MMLEAVKTTCPYCWQTIEVVIDCSEMAQEYVEDCFVCCRPILLTVSIDNSGWPDITTRQENE